MQHIEESKFGDARESSHATNPDMSPFEDPNNSQFGIVPGDAEPPGEPLPQASAPPATPAAEEMIGTPAELRSRNAQLQNTQPTRFGPSPPQTPASTVPLGFSPAHVRGLAEEAHFRQATRRGPAQDLMQEDSDSDIR